MMLPLPCLQPGWLLSETDNFGDLSLREFLARLDRHRWRIERFPRESPGGDRDCDGLTDDADPDIASGSPSVTGAITISEKGWMDSPRFKASTQRSNKGTFDDRTFVKRRMQWSLEADSTPFSASAFCLPYSVLGDVGVSAETNDAPPSNTRSEDK